MSEVTFREMMLIADRNRGRVDSFAEPASSRFISRRKICWRTMRVKSPFWSWRKRTQSSAWWPFRRW